MEKFGIWSTARTAENLSAKTVVEQGGIDMIKKVGDAINVLQLISINHDLNQKGQNHKDQSLSQMKGER